MPSSNGRISGTMIVSADLLVLLPSNILTRVGSWDTPPRPGEFGYQPFQNAFKRLLNSRAVQIPRRNKRQAKEFDDRSKGDYSLDIEGTPDLGQSPDLKLMPFQVCTYFVLSKRPGLKIVKG